MATMNVVNANQVAVIGTFTGTGAGNTILKPAPQSVFQCVLTGTGAVTATVYFEVSENGSNWISPGLATVTLNGSNSVTDGFATNAPWKYVRPNINSITGTGASLVIYMGY